MKWSLTRLFSILVLLFGLSAFFTFFSPTAFAVESYKISSEQERVFKRSIYRATNIPEDQSIDIHYYFYATNNYAEDISLIIYSCDYYDYDTGSVAKRSGCGLYMVQEAGYFKIKLISSVFSTGSYSRRTNSVNYFSSFNRQGTSIQEVGRFTDEDFDKGLILLGGTTLRENSWDRGEGGYLVDPVGGGNSSGSNNGGFNLDFGGFVKGIVDGITQFFKPMMDSIRAVTESLSGLPEFLANIPKMLEDFVKFILIPDSQVVGSQVDNFSNRIKAQAGFIGEIFTFSSNFNSKVKSSGCRLVQFVPAQASHFGGFDVCQNIPSAFIFVARPLVILLFIWITIHRIFRFISVLFGTRYMWDKEGGQE